MKRCPTCRRSYADDTLRFCLEDGTELGIVDESDDPQRTEKFPAAVTQAAHNAVRVDIPTSQTSSPRPTTPPAKSRNSLVLKVLVAIVALAVVVVVIAAGLLGVFFYLGRRESTVVYNQTPTPVPTIAPSASPDEIEFDPQDENQSLEDKIKALQKKLEEASKGDSDTEIPWDPDDLPNARTAKVNSPNDGFLALRNLPSTEVGSLIAKVPHGTTINVLICSEQSVRVGGRSGHWCMVSYNNQKGWVFDVWLSFSSGKN